MLLLTQLDIVGEQNRNILIGNSVVDKLQIGQRPDVRVWTYEYVEVMNIVSFSPKLLSQIRKFKQSSLIQVLHY